MRKIILKNAAAIVTCDGENKVYKNCDVKINGPSIEAIGEGLDPEDYQIVDATGCFIYPGMINTHHHFFQTFVRNQVSIDYPNLTVMDWIAKIYPIFSHMDSDGIYYSSMIAFADLIKHGCTCAFDHQYCYTTLTGKEAMDRQMEAAQEMGIRYHGGRGGNTLSMDQGSSIPDAMVESTDEFLNDCQRLIDRWHDPAPFSMKQVVVAPCQPINCRKGTFEESVKLARANNVRLHTHLGEGESEGMQQRYGMRTLQWCADMGFIGEDVWYAHCWELSKEEYALLSKTGTGISHCPAPAVLGGFPILNIPQLTKENVLVSLGCDGSATNDSSNMLDTLRMTYLMQAFHSKERGYNCPTPYELLKVATIHGAKTLGREDLGSLEVGKGADLFLIDSRKAELAGAVHDPANLLARTGVTGPVKMTMINGEIVWKDGVLTKIDENRLFEESERHCSKIIRGYIPSK